MKRWKYSMIVACGMISSVCFTSPSHADFDGVEAPDKFKDVDVESRPADEGGIYGDVEWPEVSPKDELTGEPAFESMLLEVPSAKYWEIQDAINVAKDGDIILVHGPYWYRPFDTRGKHLTIRGSLPKQYMREHVFPESSSLNYRLELSIFMREFEPNSREFVAIAPASGPALSTTGSVVVNGGSLTLENVWIGSGNSDRGAGIFVLDADLTLRNCVISGNQAHGRVPADALGGAVYFDSPDSWRRSTIENCHFENNSSTGSGGAIHVASGQLDISSCSFKSNSAVEGGAVMYAGGSGNIDHSTYYKNDAWKGGAIRMVGETGLSIRRCDFHKNTASFGAGLNAGNIESGSGDRSSLPKQSCSVVDCSFMLNAARFAGSGAHLTGPDMYVHGCVLESNWMPIDGGSALYFEYAWSGRPRVQGTRICSNEGDEPIVGEWIDEGANCIMSYCHSELCDNDLDVDGNGFIDWSDWSLVYAEIINARSEGRLARCYGCPEDVNRDGEVNYRDLSMISRHIYAAPSEPVGRSGTS